MTRPASPFLSTELVAVHSAPTGAFPSGLTVAHSAVIGTDAASGVWVLLVPGGSHSGRDGRGPYDAGGAASMQAIVAETKRRAGSTDLVVDYDHQSVFSAVPGVGGRAPAAGWIKEFDVRADGIHGHIEWTAAAAEAIRNREYRYISPVYKHSRDGKILALASAGLTNVPNFDLAVAAASAQATHGDTMDKIAKALGLDASASEDAILVAVNAVTADLGKIALALGLSTGAKPGEILTAANAVAEDRKAIAGALGVKVDAKGADIVTAAQSAAAGKATVVPDPTKYVPIEQVSAMQATLKELQDDRKTEKAETAVDAAISAGKLSPALRGWGLSVHSADPGQFKAFVDKAPVLTGPQRELGKVPSTSEAALTEEDVAVMRQMGISEADMIAARKKETA